MSDKLIDLYIDEVNAIESDKQKVKIFKKVAFASLGFAAIGVAIIAAKNTPMIGEMLIEAAALTGLFSIIEKSNYKSKIEDRKNFLIELCQSKSAKEIGLVIDKDKLVQTLNSLRDNSGNKLPKVEIKI